MPPIKNKIVSVKKRERHSISLEVKSKILALNSRGLSTSVIANQLNMPRTTVQTIIKEKSKITTAIENSVSMKTTTIRNQQGLITEMEKLLFTWIQDQIQRRVPLSLAIIQSKALSLFKTLKENKGDDVQQDTFAASRGWFMRFKKRYALHNIAVQGEAASADEEAARDFPETLWKIIQEEGLSANQVFNVDETGLFWKKMPSRTYISQEEKSMPGFKVAKDRLTLLLGSNAEGDFKLKPLLVYRSENPRALKNYAKGTLPVIWKSNSKAWVTGNLFEEWFTRNFIPEVKNYCARKNIAYKALLLLDNAHYLRKTFSQAVEANDVNGMDLKTFWKNFSILDGVKNIATSWEEIKSSNLKGVWKKVCPRFFGEEIQEDIQLSTPLNEITADIVNIANSLPGIELESEDVTEMLSSHSQELTDEDLVELEHQRLEDNQEVSVSTSSNEAKHLTSKKLIEAFNHLHAAMEIFEKNDPNFERSFEVNNNINLAYKCYRDVHETQKQDAKQKRLDDFFIKKT